MQTYSFVNEKHLRRLDLYVKLKESKIPILLKYGQNLNDKCFSTLNLLFRLTCKKYKK